MNSTVFRLFGSGAILFFMLASVATLEFYGHIFEKGIGYYLKWQNPKRRQLGRAWETEHENTLAQRQVQSLLTSLNTKERNSESIDTLKTLVGTLNPSNLVSRKKFLQLYFDYPGQWARRIIDPWELLKIDSNKDWDRVLLSRSGQWITLSFIDPQNHPIHEVFLRLDILYEVQSTRTIQRGFLEEANFEEKRIFSIEDFLPLLQTLDPATQNNLFPDPKWFLQKDYHVTRVGIASESLPDRPEIALFGIEYKTDYYTNVLLIPVPLETSNNILSQIEQAVSDEFDDLYNQAGAS